MTVLALKCPNCAAPLPLSGGKSMVCGYCDHVLVDLPDAWWARPVTVPAWEGRPEDRGKPRVGLGRHTYVLERCIRRSAKGEVFLARRDARLTERVVLEVALGEPDGASAEALAREWRAIARLKQSRATGASFFARMLPSPVAHGRLRRDGRASEVASAYRHRVGFDHTLADVRRRFPDGVDPRAAVWMWKRALEMLSWVHASGFVHGAILPAHMLVSPRDHGVALIDWSAATWRHGRSHGAPPSPSAPPEPRTDLVLSARAIAHVLGGDVLDDGVSRLPGTVPATLRALVLESATASAILDARTLHETLVAVAAEVFGPPRYAPFSMDEPD